MIIGNFAKHYGIFYEFTGEERVKLSKSSSSMILQDGKILGDIKDLSLYHPL